MKIALDIGHANRTGSTGNGYEEHTLCTALAAHLQTILQQHGHTADIIDYPALTNKEDLVATVRAINAGAYDITLSLHADAADNANARGGHVCFYPGSVQGETLARAIAASLANLLPGRDETVVPRKNLYILKKTACPAVLIENGFITNHRDAATLAQSPHAIALAIAHGVECYASKQKNQIQE